MKIPWSPGFHLVNQHCKGREEERREMSIALKIMCFNAIREYREGKSGKGT